ncbi:hypothetical protein TcasGA2_TC012486 [Tribolium castaneum]|uniref:Uncharacterized protein n=1 Tax=Tribolium castaneum TaxID=7070 RepID=D6X2Q5_TRICA|nr:hypothetical protein TcasGA2_TC012486 [Tribolium castaneum]
MGPTWHGTHMALIKAEKSGSLRTYGAGKIQEVCEEPFEFFGVLITMRRSFLRDRYACAEIK